MRGRALGPRDRQHLTQMQVAVRANLDRVDALLAEVAEQARHGVASSRRQDTLGQRPALGAQGAGGRRQRGQRLVEHRSRALGQRPPVLRGQRRRAQSPARRQARGDAGQPAPRAARPSAGPTPPPGPRTGRRARPAPPLRRRPRTARLRRHARRVMGGGVSAARPKEASQLALGQRPGIAAIGDQLVNDAQAARRPAVGPVRDRAQHARHARRIAGLVQEPPHLQLDVRPGGGLAVDLQQRAIAEHHRRIGLLDAGDLQRQRRGPIGHQLRHQVRPLARQPAVVSPSREVSGAPGPAATPPHHRWPARRPGRRRCRSGCAGASRAACAALPPAPRSAG